MSYLRIFLLTMAAAGSIATSARAQATLFDSQFLRTSCLQNTCEAALRGEVGRLVASRLESAELNSQLGAMAAILVDLARGASAEKSVQIARALLFLAQYSNDEIQRNSLLQLAQAIADGTADLFDLQQPFAVSPN